MEAEISDGALRQRSLECPVTRTMAIPGQSESLTVHGWAGTKFKFHIQQHYLESVY